MKTTLRFAALLLALMPFTSKAQFTFSDVTYWIGSGADSALLVVDFHDSYWDSSYAWGYRYDGIKTGEDMLNDVASDDSNLSVSIAGFLNDITYGPHSGIGSNPAWWGTYSGTDASSLAQNGGITDTLVSGQWFACSYTDFAPEVLPGNPIPAFEPIGIDDISSHVDFWIGTGLQTSVLAIDFHDGTGGSSFTWGYRHDGSKTAEDMLNDIAAADGGLSVAIAGFLNDITYNSYAGIGSSPAWWSTWTATNLGNWEQNIGIGTAIVDGEIFGCSYTDFAPVLRPSSPSPALDVSVEENVESVIAVYPQPAENVLNISLKSADAERIRLYDLTGKIVLEKLNTSTAVTLNIAELAAGVYVLEVGTTRRKIVKK